MAGINDPYELYQHVHPSEIGASLGSGMGGMELLSAMFRDRYVTMGLQMRDYAYNDLTVVRRRTFKRISCRKREFNRFLSFSVELTGFYSFINTVAGWVNLLLMSSSGPVKIPVGAW
jgi:fatty acid synthase subunit alpha, fungi type